MFLPSTAKSFKQEYGIIKVGLAEVTVRDEGKKPQPETTQNTVQM